METTTGLRRTLAATRRSEAARARADTRDAAVKRRARTRRLIELGGLVAKSNIEEAITEYEPDTRAVLLGMLLELAEGLDLNATGEAGMEQRMRVAAWCARGRHVLRTASTEVSTDT